MKSLFKVTIAVAGTILGVFIINILLFCYVPAYHDALENAVANDKDIPVVTVDSENGNVVIYSSVDDEQMVQTVEIQDEESEMVPLTSGAAYSDSSFTRGNKSDDEAEKPQIIDKEYHEDCGSGKGYWVITYSDGSTSVE